MCSDCHLAGMSGIGSESLVAIARCIHSKSLSIEGPDQWREQALFRATLAFVHPGLLQKPWLGSFINIVAAKQPLKWQLRAHGYSFLKARDTVSVI